MRRAIVIVVLLGIAALTSWAAFGAVTRAVGGGCPPTPKITGASRDAQHVFVDLDLPKSSCAKTVLLVRAFSAADQSNMAPPLKGGGPAGDGSRVWYHAGHRRITLKRPALDLPPYVVNASAVDWMTGRRSEVVQAAMPERGDYCARHRERDCLAEAHALFERCLRGKVARARCADWVYRAQPPFPITPVERVSVAQVEQSLHEVLKRELTVEGVLSSHPRVASVTCNSAFDCTARFVLDAPRGDVRVHYPLTGYHQAPGCWLASDVEVLAPSQSRYLGEAARRNLSGCVSGVNHVR